MHMTFQTESNIMYIFERNIMMHSGAIEHLRRRMRSAIFMILGCV